MLSIGIDVGSTYTKYCIMEDPHNFKLFTEKTPVRQSEYFLAKIKELTVSDKDCAIVSCGYGKDNAGAVKRINELTALSRGAYFISKDSEFVLDIGGQDTKIIRQVHGSLKSFFINDRKLNRTTYSKFQITSERLYSIS